MRNVMTKISSIALALLLLAVAGGTARAQLGTVGAIQGRVTDEATGEPLAGVTVVATSPALQGTQSEITDESGFYQLPNLPPGTYEVTFFYSELKVVRKNVEVDLGRTTQVSVKMNTSAAGGEVIEIEEKAPAVDVGSTKQGVVVDKDYAKNVPFPGRNYSGALSAAAGSQYDPTGISFSGSTGMENNYIIDGINTTGLQFGTIGSPLLNNFIQEIEIITGGYDAEFGRSTGGVVNVITKSGSNEFHGSVWTNFEPGFLRAEPKRISVAGSSLRAETDLNYYLDMGFDLGGPIIKDKLWFYVGFAPILSSSDVTRIVSTRIDREMNLNNYANEPDPDGDPTTTRDPGCEVTQTCESDGRPDVDRATGLQIFEEIPGTRRHYTSKAAQYQFTGKLNLAVTPDHQGALTFIGSPSTADSIGISGTPFATQYALSGGTYDASLKWTSKFRNNKTQVDATFGLHREQGITEPAFERNGAGMPIRETSAISMNRVPTGLNVPIDLGYVGRNPDFNEDPDVVAFCTDAPLDPTIPDPFPNIQNCPVASYRFMSPGFYDEETAQRLSARLDVTERLKLAGHHELKAGVDIEDNSLDTVRSYLGGQFNAQYYDLWEIDRYVRFGEGPDTCMADLDHDGMPEPHPCTFLSTLTSDGQTVNWSAYLQDKWQILPNLTLKAGLRYEEQVLKNAKEVVGKFDPILEETLGENAIELRNLWAPRVGLLYDWTKEGRSKIYANFGRFYESIPMRINSRMFGGETTYYQQYEMTSSCGSGFPGAPLLPSDPRNCTGTTYDSGLNSASTSVAPGLKPQYMDELVLGVEYELLEDLNVGLAYQNRRLGRVIEDVSADGALTYMVANPGEFDEEAEAELMQKINEATDPMQQAKLQERLDFLREVRAMDKPTRNYNAVQLTAKKRMSRDFFVQGSYTWSRLEGNFPGLYEYEYAGGQEDPNITFAFDLPEFMANRQGRLPIDRTHIGKLDGYYIFDLKEAGQITTGLRFRAQSGTPTNALGRHRLYGTGAIMILPRGSFGRTEFVTGADLKIAYGRKLAGNMMLQVYFDILNVFNQQQVGSVDQNYTFDFVQPIVNGDKEDLKYLKRRAAAGAPTYSAESNLPPLKNLNFQNAASRYAPLATRFGVILTF